MKLHLPTKLYAAVMALFTIGVNTTLGSDIISINFGSAQVTSDAGGDLWGAGGDDWNNFAVGSAVTQKQSLIGLGTGDDRATYGEAITITKVGRTEYWPTDKNQWPSTTNVASKVQSTYIDLNEGNPEWIVNLTLPDVVSAADAAHTRVDLKMYFSSDGTAPSAGQYSPVSVGDTNYIGGQDVVTTSNERWGKRGNAESGTIGGDNTIWVTNLDVADLADLTIKNVWVDQTARATISGMQIKLTDVYDSSLSAGNNVAENVTWSGVGNFSGKYTDIADIAQRYLRADVTAGAATLSFANGAQIATLHAKGGNKLTVSSDGSISVGELYAESGTTISLGSGVLSSTQVIALAGAGTVEMAGNQNLAGIAGVGNLVIADGVAVNVSSFDFAGTITGGTNSALNVSLAPGASSTVNGIEVTNVSGTVGMNALASGVTDVNCSDGASIGIASSGGTLLVQGVPGSTVNLASLSLTGNAETKLTTAEGVALAGTLGSELLNDGKSLSVGKNVSLKYTTEDYSLGIGTATLTINGGSVEAVSFRMGEGGSNRQSVLNITDGGLLNITGNVNSTGRNGTVRLCHWEGGSTSTLNVENGEFRVLDANVNVGDVGANTTINVGADGIVNVKGFFRSENYTAFTTNVAAGGVLNLGEVGVNISNSAAANLSISGTLGALSENGWSSGKTVTFNDGAILQLAVWDVENKQYTSTAADIKLTGANAGTGALTLAGSGSLIISSALANDVSLAEGATATLKLQGFGGFVYTNDGTYSGYGENTENGYNNALNYAVAGAGSTLDKVTVITGTGDAATETEYSLSNGAITITDSTKFFVNTDVTRSKIDEVREGTSFVLASGAIYRTDVLDDLKSLTVADKTAAVYVQSAEGKDLLKLTNVPNNWKPGLTVEGNTITAAAPNYTADFTVLSGATLKLNGNDNAGVNYLTNTNRTITVGDKATLDLGGYEAYYHMVLEEGATITNSGGALGTDKRSLPIVDLLGNATVSTDTQFGILGSGYSATKLNLNENTLTKVGSGVFHIHNCTIDKGTISIKDGAVEILQRGATSDVTFVVNGSAGEGGTVGSLKFSVDSSMAGLVGNGGNVTVDANRNVTILDKLTGSGFTKQGSGILTLSNGMQIADNMSINVQGGAITLSAINVAANKELAIAGAVQADELNKLGAGTLSIASLTANCISYTAGMGTLEIESLAGNTIIDVTSMGEALAGGVNLGIKNTETNKANISVVAIEDGTWELVDDGYGYLKLQAKAGSALAVSTDWDINWSQGLVGEPNQLAAVELSATTALYNAESPALTAAALTGEGSAAANIVGGVIRAENAPNSTVSTEVWLHVESGAYNMIVGGNDCAIWQGNGHIHFDGNTHILVGKSDSASSVASVGAIVGGNYKDSGGSNFSGSSYISVYDGAKVGSIVGGSVSAHGTSTFTGTTNVFVYTSLASGDGWSNAADTDIPADVIVGGSLFVANANAGRTHTHEAGTNVTVDLSNDETIERTIVGGDYIIYANQTSNLKGASTVTISGGTLKSKVIGGTYIGANSTASLQAVNVNIDSGSFSESIYGGAYHNDAGTSNIGNITLSITGGSYEGSVVAGSYLHTNGGNLTVRNTAITINGVNAELGDVIGGHQINGAGDTNMAASMGDSSITLSAGKVGNIYGGSYSERDAGGSTITQGDIVVDLQGGSVTGDVYAAGYQGGATKLVTSSTTVKVGSGVTLTDGKTISGDAKGTTGGVTGDRVLLFTGNADQDRSGVVIKDFDKIGVETAGKTATIGALTATEAITIDGKGTIKLGGAATLTGGATVEGALDMNGQSVTGDVTVNGSLATGGGSITGVLTLAEGATTTGALAATSEISVAGKLTAADGITTTKITGEGSVEITGGTVTLSDATDAFANAGTTSIAGADLAGTWTAGDVTIGAGVTASGTITLANSTINSTMTASGKISLANSTINSIMRTTGEGSIALSGDVTVGVTGVEGNAFYTHNGTVDAAGNGFKSASTDYALVNGTSTAAEGTNWLIDGTTATNATYANGTLTVKTNADLKTYWVNTGIVSYDGAAATYGEPAQSQSLSDTTKSIKLNGGTLELTTSSVTAGYISASTVGGTLDVNGQSITQAIFGTLEGTVSLKGTGAYSLGSRVTALATNVALGTGWTGTVKMSDVTLGNDAYSAFAANKLEVTNATITDKLVMNGGTLTLAGEMDVTGLSYETTVTWSSGKEGTGFSFTSREMKVVDTTAGGSVVKGDDLSWKADGGYDFEFEDGVLTMNDNAWTTVYNIKAGDEVYYSADDAKFTNDNGFAATSICMNGSTLNLNSELADNLLDGGIEVNATGNTISINGTELAKGSLSVQSGADVALTGNGIYDLSASTANTELGTGVSLAAGWTGTVKMGDVTATGEVDLSSLGNAGSIVSGGAVSVGSLAGTAVNLEADSVALTNGASTLGTLTTGALTLGGADSVGSLAVGTLNVTSGVITFNQLDASLLAIDELATSLNLDISESLLLTAVSQTESKSLKLMTVTDLDGKTITLNGGTSWDSADKQYTYKLDIIGGVVTITSKINGSVWAGDADNNTWSEGGSWSADTAPTVEDSVVFNGTGCSEVIVSGNVTAQSVTIDVGAEIEAEDIETEIYEFVGGSTKDTLTIEKNLSVNKGTLVLAVNTSVAGRSEVVADAALDVIAGNLASQYGFNNAGTLNIGSTSQTSTLVSVVGGDMINTGTINNEASLIIGSGSPDAATAAPNLINSGTIASSGIIGVDGNLVNSGTGSLEQTGSSLMVRGTLNNSATVEVSGAATQVTLGAAVNSGTLNVKEGSVVIGAFDEPGLIADGADVQNGDLDNSDGTITLGTDSTSASLTVNGDITGNAGGSITVMEGSTLTVTGDLNNAGGTLTLSGEDAIAKIGGDLIMKDGASEGVLTVGQDASLTVDGKLAASEMMLEFGGNVTVGGDVEIGTLTNKGEFIANGSEDTEVHIGTLNNAAGTLTVGVMQNGVLTGGNLEIGTLTGTGVVNVGEGGTLSIDTDTAFTGQLNNLGTLYITSTTLDSAQEEAGQTAGNITTEKLTITDQATGYKGDSYQLGEVATDTLVIDGTSSMDAGSTRLSMESLAAKTADGKVAIVLSDVEEMVRGTGDVTDSSYHLITSADGTEKPFLAGSITEKLDLGRYGYDENGEYDATKASVQSDYMQHLLQQNKYVVFSDSDPLAGTATLDVATGTSDLYAAITELSEELSVWNLDGAHDMTEAGLTVLKGGKLVSDDILDNVQKVVVTGEQSLELTGKQTLAPELDLSHVTLNNLTASEDGTPVTLSISGDSSATDSATITAAADGFAGTLALSKVSADITGKVDTIEVGADLNAMLDVSDADINLGSRDATFGGNLKGGSINFGVGSKELGVSVMKGDLAVNGTAINVQQTDSSIVIGGVGLGDEKTVIADLDSTKGSAAVTLIGKGYDKYFENARLEGGNVVADRNDTYATDKIQPSTENGAAGAELLDNLLVEINPQATAPDSDMAKLLDAVDTDRMSDETAAALAGSSISALGLALSGDVERQLRSIRNRTTTMGVNECVVNEGMPYFNAWFNTESNRTKLDADSTNPGYTLDSWGGTVGFDVDVNPNFTMGLAISAMYGSITTEGPDMLDGDMDTYYLSLFARYADCAWTHTFVATLGKMDGSITRTVLGEAMDTSIDGASFGLMYEVGYVIPLDEDGEACVQPIFNVMLRHSSVGSFTEDGDLGLDVDKQGMTTLTFGLGARMQAVVGESVYNRASIFEGRILAKADLGDRQSEADVAFVNGGSHKATVKSAELGTIGLELGAGLTIPLGDDDGSLFFDASVELRSGYTDVNGTVGYRINF